MPYFCRPSHIYYCTVAAVVRAKHHIQIITIETPVNSLHKHLIKSPNISCGITALQHQQTYNLVSMESYCLIDRHINVSTTI